MNEAELKLDKTPLTFGKHRGKTPDEISEIDPSYIVWLYNNIKPHKCSEWLKEVCQQEQYEDEDDDTNEIEYPSQF